MKTPEKILNTGKTLIWLEKNDKELFEAHIKACTDPGTYEDYTQWKYDSLERTEQMMQTTLSLGQFVAYKDRKVLEKPDYKGEDTTKEMQEAWEDYADACKEIWFENVKKNHVVERSVGTFELVINRHQIALYKGQPDYLTWNYDTTEQLITQIDIKGTDTYWSLIFK